MFAVVFAAVTVVLSVVVLNRWGLDGASLLWTVVGVAAALLAGGQRAPRTSQTEDLDAHSIVPRLAAAARSRYEQDARIRGLHDPWPIPVSWRNTTRPVADHWEAIRGTPGDRATIELAGSTDDVGATLARVPSKRLVILGEPGAGKTTLASLLMLDLFAARGDEDPVPIMFSLVDWNPSELPFAAWLTSRLREDFPGLESSTSNGMAHTTDLLNSGHIIPVLDGLDEMPAAHRGIAIKAVNMSFGRGKPIVLTCRGTEFEQAVQQSDVVTAAAVIELNPLPPSSVADYLHVVTSPSRASQWLPVLATLSSAPDGPLAQALSTPLMLWLARVIYTDGGRDPQELVESSADHADPLRARLAVELRLLEGFLPAAYAASSTRTGREWAGEDAHTWLSFLARVALHNRAQHISWWDIDRMLPRYVLGAIIATASLAACWLPNVLGAGFMAYWTGAGFALGMGIGVTALLGVVEQQRVAPAQVQMGLFRRTVVDLSVVLGGTPPPGESVRKGAGRAMKGILIGLITGSVAGAAFTLMIRSPGNSALQLIDGLALGSAYGLAAGVISALLGPDPAEADWRPFVRLRLFVHRLVMGLAFGYSLGWAYGAARGALSPSFDVLRGFWYEAGIFGAVTALAFGIIAGTSAWFGIPADVEAATPMSVMRADRSAAFIRSATAGAATGVAAIFALGGTLGSADWYVDALRFGVPAGATLGLMVGTIALVLTTWGRFTVARCLLAVAGRLPWRWTAFLDDAHQRGVLRQSGGAYQFRHGHLLTHLARPPRFRRNESGPATVVARPEHPPDQA